VSRLLIETAIERLPRGSWTGWPETALDCYTPRSHIMGRTQQRYVKFRETSRKPLCHSSWACSSSSRTPSGRDTLIDRPGGDARPQSKSPRFDVHRIRYGLRSRKLPGNTPLFECFADERLSNAKAGLRDRRRLASSAELYVPLLGNTLSSYARRFDTPRSIRP